MGRSAKIPSRTALLAQLGEEALALFRSGALPVPAKLRVTVAALDAGKDEPEPDAGRKSKVAGRKATKK